MRKFFSIFTVCFLILGISGCIQKTDTQKAQTVNDKQNKEDTAIDSNKILIVYYSRSGNTEQLAQLIHSYVGGDMIELETEKQYAEDYDTILEEAEKEKQEQARPALKSTIEDISQYDYIFIGYPIWWADTPMAILTFMESHSFTNKTLIPFCTSGGGGSGSSFESITKAANQATVLEGYSIIDTKIETAAPEVKEWLKKIGL